MDRDEIWAPQGGQFQGQPQGGQPQQQGQRRVIKEKKDIAAEAEHIKEHMEHVDTSKMTEQELQFHYFKMHDTGKYWVLIGQLNLKLGSDWSIKSKRYFWLVNVSDGNNKLDGLELVKSLIHWHDEANHDPKSGQPKPEAKIFADDELKNMIDPILESDDKNKDGFIDYPEFIAAQQAAATSGSTP